MPVTREIISECPDGSRVVEHRGDNYLQHFLNGKWATINKTDLPVTPAMPAEIPKATSGSCHDHAALSASGSKCWLNCLAAPAFVEENADRIFEMDVQSVIRLTPYLKSLPPEEVFPHEGRAMRWVKDIQNAMAREKDPAKQGEVFAREIAKLTPEQRKDIKRAEGSEYSREGTRAHEFATQIFNGEKTLDDIPEEFRQPVGVYVDFCMGLRDGDETFFTEAKIPYFYDPEQSGTVDFRILRDEEVIIADYKHGQGELVDAEDNSQCAIYALSVIEDLEAREMRDMSPDTRVRIFIVQPRHHGGEPIKEWDTTKADLQAMKARIQEVHDRIVEGGELPFSPSDEACKWCKCKAFCPARAEAMTAMLDSPDYTGFDLLKDLPDIGEIEGTTTKKEFNSRPAEEKVNARLGSRAPLDDATLIAVRRNYAAILEWVADVKEYVDSRVLSGDPFAEGQLKIVQGNAGDRAWVDEAAADKLLGNRLKASEKYTKKLISPAKAEKLIDLKKETPRFKNLWNAAITRAEGGKVVADITDKRAAVPAMSADLEDIEDDEPDYM